MSYIFNVPRYKKSGDLNKVLNQSAFELHKELDSINYEKVDLSEYNKRYINDIRNNAIGYLQVYNYLIEVALKQRSLNLKNYTFIDYGGGSGILSLLAKKIGFGTVVYNDIYEVSCNDAQELSKIMKIPVDHFVKGDIDDLIRYCKTNHINADFVVGSDVIEHVYNVNQFLEKIPLLSSETLTMVMGTGATPFNPRVRKKLIKGHIRSEFEDRTPQYGHKLCDSLQSFYQIRKTFIKDHLVDICDEELDRLAKETRGLILEDIEKELVEYKRSGKISYTPDHPTNTCDPLTGNWNEQLHDVNKLITILKNKRMEASVLSSYYMYSNSKPVQLVKTIINYLIRFTGRFGLLFSPYYIIVAQKNN